MSIGDLLPLVIYDDRCYLCSKFASVVHAFSRGKIPVIGHYSDTGMKIKSQIFDRNYDSTTMFWFVTEKTAYGGRAAIFPLIWNICTSKSRDRPTYESSTTCNLECKTPKAFFIRSASLLSNSKKIAIEI